MKIIWSRKAASSFHQIETYILRTFGEKTQKEFTEEVKDIVNTRLNKIVYYIKDDTIRIAAMWDTRREPKAQARKVR